jgi:ATP-binding cassette subfamily F protein 3
VIFTSHDRHFLKRLATSIIEVRDGRVVNYGGDYESYLWSVNKEIEEGEREAASARLSKAPTDVLHAKGTPKAEKRDDRALRKEKSNLEKTIARLDEQKKAANAKLLETTNAKEALDLHHEVEELSGQLAEAEERWCVLAEELGEW